MIIPPTVIDSNSPTATMKYVGQNGKWGMICSCNATVNIEAAKITAVTVNFHTSFVIFRVARRQVSKTRNVAIPPIGTSSGHIPFIVQRQIIKHL